MKVSEDQWMKVLSPCEGSSLGSPDHAVPQLHHLRPPHPLRPGGQVIAADLDITRIIDEIINRYY